jgi:hypothetical protein
MVDMGVRTSTLFSRGARSGKFRISNVWFGAS